MGISKESKNVISVAVGMLILLLLTATISPLARTSMITFAALCVGAIAIYAISAYQGSLTGLSKNRLAFNIILGVILGAVFYFASRIIPAFSIIAPILPQSISDQLKWFIIVFVSPIVETIFFQGAVLGYAYSITKNKATAVIISAVLFALFHSAAYIVGFYNLPNISAGATAFLANISGFIAAFTFAVIAGGFTVSKPIKNLVFAGVLHFFLNLILFTSLSVVFALTLGMIG